jgi:plastocyanin
MTIAGLRWTRLPIAVAPAAAVGLALAIGLAACAGTGLGADQPPASLDPASPTLAADGIAFDKSELQVSAGRAFTIVFENREGVGHNVSIYAEASRQQKLFEGVVVMGPATRWYPVPALAAGTYVFMCDLHSNMTGRLVAA